MPLAVGIFGALSWWLGLRRCAGLTVAILTAWALELGESGNLWDYLIDPWVALYALARVAGEAFRRRGGAKAPPRAPPRSRSGAGS